MSVKTIFIYLILKIIFFPVRFFLHRKYKKTALFFANFGIASLIYFYKKKVKAKEYTRIIYELFPDKFWEFYIQTHDNYWLLDTLKSFIKHNNYCVNKSDLFNRSSDATNDVIFKILFDQCTVSDIQEWCNEGNGILLTLQEPGQFTFSLPKILNDNQPETPHALQEPESFIACLDDVIINQNAGILANRDSKLHWVVYEPQAHPKYTFVASYWRQFIHYNENNRTVFIPKQKNSSIKLDQAILINGRCSENYFHWMIEYLSRFYAIEKQSEFDLKNVPLLVPDHMPAQHYEVLQIIAPNNPIHFYNENENIDVKKLYTLSIPTLHYDDRTIPYWQGSSINLEYLTFLREKILQSEAFLKDNTKCYPNKIFVARPSGNCRGIVNQAAIEKFLLKNDFVIIYPERLPFIEQVRYFANADVIIGINGAALTNLIFVKPSAKAFILINKNIQDFCMQYNLAKLVGKCEVYHIGGEPHGKIKYIYPYEEKMARMSQDYSINISDLEKALKI
jgi:capsular polysaccharide biosynthesis protein